VVEGVVIKDQNTTLQFAAALLLSRFGQRRNMTGVELITATIAIIITTTIELTSVSELWK
jgi:hypothetical protein